MSLAADSAVSEALARLVRDVHDFPEPGIVFKDITPLLADPAGFHAVVQALADVARDESGTPTVDAIVGMEARGFLFGVPVAMALGVGFIPVRKPGKLPSAVHSVSYSLEYGDSTLQIHRDALNPGDRVLVVDDVLATGGTLRATRELIEACSATVVGAALLMELAFLNGREQVADLPITSLSII
ncbi:adenine phosphoribosyltransferase [Nocardioides salsibiostraticola]